MDLNAPIKNNQIDLNEEHSNQTVTFPHKIECLDTKLNASNFATKNTPSETQYIGSRIDSDSRGVRHLKGAVQTNNVDELLDLIEKRLEEDGIACYQEHKQTLQVGHKINKIKRQFSDLQNSQVKRVFKDNFDKNLASFDVSASKEFYANLEKKDDENFDKVATKIKKEKNSFLNKIIQKSHKDKIDLGPFKFECSKCKEFKGQFKFQTKIMNDKDYIIIVNGFDHNDQCLVLVFFKFDFEFQQMVLVKRVNLFYTNTPRQCVSLCFASYATRGHDIIYFTSKETETHNIFEIRKIDLNDIKENDDELIDSVSIQRKDNCQVIGVLVNKPIIKFSDENSTIVKSQETQGFSQEIKDFDCSVFYSHSSDIEHVHVEIRLISDFSQLRFSKVLPMDITQQVYSTLIHKEAFYHEEDFSQIPEKMIAIHALSARTGEKMFYFLEQKGEKYEFLMLPQEEKGEFTYLDGKNNILYEIPNDEYGQYKLPKQFKQMTQDVRNAFQYFYNNEFQYFYEYYKKYENKTSSYIIAKSKPESVFDSIHQLSKMFEGYEQIDLEHQKCNLVNDQNKRKVFLILMKSPLLLQTWLIDTQIGYRTQIYDEKDLSTIDYQVRQIFMEKTQIQTNLTFFPNFRNMLRDPKNVYCFEKNTMKKIKDTSQKVNFYAKNFMYYIDESFYNQIKLKGPQEVFSAAQNMSKYNNIKKLQHTATIQNMSCKILNDHGVVNTTLFIQYVGFPYREIQEYYLEWNNEFRIDPNLDNDQKTKEKKDFLPIRVQENKAKIEKAKREINPLQIQFQKLRNQSDTNPCAPFIGIKKNGDQYEALWLGILECNARKVLTCNQIDLTSNELASIKSIHFFKNFETVQNLPKDCLFEKHVTVAIWFGDDKWIMKFFEYKIRFWKHNEDVEKVTVELYGQKFLIGEMDPTMDLREHGITICQLLDSKMEIIGSLLDFQMIHNPNQDLKVFELQNFQDKDFQYQNHFCYFGYKKYNFNYAALQNVLLVEVKLKEEVYKDKEFFSRFDRSQILDHQVMATLNHVPFEIESYLQCEGDIQQDEYNFFQPAQILNGTSQFTYNIMNPHIVYNKTTQVKQDKELKRISKNRQFYASLLDQILGEGENPQRSFLRKIGTLSFMIPDCKSLLTPLNYCFKMKTLQVQTCHVIFKWIFDSPVKTEYDQMLMMSILQNVHQVEHMNPEMIEFFMKEDKFDSISSLSFEREYNHALLPRGSEAKRMTIDFNPELITTKCFHNHVFDVINHKESQIQGQKYQVEYSYFDFRQMNYQKKIDYFLVKQESDLDKDVLEPQVITELQIQELFEIIINASGEKIEQMVSIQKIIDRVFFDFTRHFFLAQTFTYLIGFICPLLWGEFYPEQRFITMPICSITMSIFCFIEFLDLFLNGLNYFQSIWNVFDILQILSWFTYFIIEWTENFSYNGSIKEYTNEMVRMNILKVFIVLVSFEKIISFCRVFEGFAGLINMLTKVLVDLKNFQIFFLLLIVFFTVIMRVLSCHYNEMKDMPHGANLIINSFELSIGFFNYPKYLKIGVNDDLSDSMAGIQLIMIYVTWFFNQYMILVIMLNFLISVIGDTYTEVSARQKMHTYRYRNQLNLEYLSVRNNFLNPKQITCQIFIVNQEDYQMQEDEFVENILESIDDLKEEVALMKDTLGKKIQNMDTRMKSVENLLLGIKSMMESQVGAQKN